MVDRGARQEGWAKTASQLFHHRTVLRDCWARMRKTLLSVVKTSVKIVKEVQRTRLFPVVLDSKDDDLTICQPTQKAPIKAQDSSQHHHQPLAHKVSSPRSEPGQGGGTYMVYTTHAPS